MKHLEVKIFVAATMLLNLLDETEGNPQFKHKLRQNINRLTKELEKITNAPTDNTTCIFINEAWTALETSIDNRLEIIANEVIKN